MSYTNLQVIYAILNLTVRAVITYVVMNIRAVLVTLRSVRYRQVSLTVFMGVIVITNPRFLTWWRVYATIRNEFLPLST